VPWQIVDPVVDFDVALIFQEADEAPDPRCLVRFILAAAPNTGGTGTDASRTAGQPIVDRADRDPMQFQPMQEMADRRAKQNRTA
jgi:hypothetical protein